MSLPEATRKALAAQKRQSVKETRRKLEDALRRLVNGNPQVVKNDTRITAASVAKEAGVDRVTLYRFHEPILVDIRKINDTLPKAQLKESRSELTQASARLKEYRQLVEEAQEEVAALARINYRLDGRIAELEELIRMRDEVIAGLQRQVNERESKSKVVSFSSSTYPGQR